MFRVTKLVFTRNFHKVPLLSRVDFPKQVTVEYSTAADKKIKQKEAAVPTAQNTEIKQQNLGDSSLLQELYKQKILYDFRMSRRNHSVSRLLHETINEDPKRVVQLLKVMAEARDRSLNILDIISTLIETENCTFSVNEISDILYSFAKLTYKNKKVMTTLIKQLKNQMKTKMRSNDVISIIHSFGVLKYRDPELLDTLLESVLNNSKLEIKSALECLMSISFLNCPSKHAETLIKFLSGVRETDFNSTSQFISFIWCCVILNKLEYISESHLKNLSETYMTDIVFQNCHEGVRLKLLNIFAGARYLSHLQLEGSEKISLSVKKPTKQTAFFESVLDAMSYILPNPGYFKTYVDTHAGFYLDVKYQIDSRNSPAVLSTSGKGISKIGILLLDYKETCSDNTPTGIFAFKVNILKKQNYKVVVISHVDYPLHSPISVKVDFLREKISKALSSEDNETSATNVP